MLEAINVLINYKEHHTLEEAKSDPVVYFGLVKHVEIIGEAVYKLTHEFRDAHPVLNWADIERMRHVLVHGYYKSPPVSFTFARLSLFLSCKPLAIHKSFRTFAPKFHINTYLLWQDRSEKPPC